MLGDASCRALLQVSLLGLISHCLGAIVPCGAGMRAPPAVSALPPHLLHPAPQLLQVFGYIYPAYLCFKDLETRQHDRIKLWCMYW